MSDVNTHPVTIVGGVATFDWKALIKLCLSLIKQALVVEPDVYEQIIDALISGNILEIHHRNSNPTQLLDLLLIGRTSLQVEAFCVILLGGREDRGTKESRRHLRDSFASRVLQEIQSSVISPADLPVHTLHTEHPDLSKCLLDIFIHSQHPQLTSHIDYSNLTYTSGELLQHNPSTGSLNSSTLSSATTDPLSSQDTEGSQLEDTSCESTSEKASETHVFIPEDQNDSQVTKKDKMSRKMKCVINIISAAVLLAWAIGGGSAAVYFRNSDNSVPVPQTTTDEPQDIAKSTSGLSSPQTPPPVLSKLNPKQIPSPTPKPTSPKSSTTSSTPAPPRKDPPIRNYSSVFLPPQGTIFFPQESDLSDTKLYSKELCSPHIPHKTLNISATHTASRLSFNVPCSSNVTGLEISGPISLRNLYSLLKKFPHTQYLSISGDDICDSLEQTFVSFDSTAKSKPKPQMILLESLSFIRLWNIPECPALYRFVNELLQIPAVSTLVLEDVFISGTNAEEVQKFFRKPKAIKHFSLKARSICPDCQVFSRPTEDSEDPWRLLEVLSFHVPPEVGFQGFLNLKGLLLPSLPLLEYFDSSVEIPCKGSLKMFKRLLNLRHMNAAINFPNNQTQFSASFFASFPFLREAFVSLKFNETSACRQNRKVSVSLTNLKRNVAASSLETLVMTSNCDINPVKGWSIPCFEFQVTNDPPTRMQTVNMTKCPNCYNSGCLR